MAKIDYNALPQPNQRLYDIVREKMNGNVSAFSEKLSVNQQNVARLFSIDKRMGKYPSVPPALLEAVARVYNIRYNWLLTGEGEMKEDADGAVAADQPGEPSEMSRILSLLEASHETIRKRDEQIDRLITLLEKEAERTEAITRRAV